MKMKKILALLLFLMAITFSASAQNGVVKELLMEKYHRQLKHVTTARDSIRIMYYLFDLGDRAAQKDLAWKLYNTAVHAQDMTTQMDMLRNMAVFHYKNDSIMNLLQTLADKIPNEEARTSTKTFIFNQQVNFRTGFPEDEKKIGAMLLDSIVNSHNLQGNDVYDRIALLYQIIQYIGTEAGGSLFAECMDKYAMLIDRLPESDFPLKNQFYTTSAIFHSRMNGDQRRSVIYDKKLLEIMDMLQNMYIKQNRKYRNYDANKFTSYRRMLSNFKVLSPSEVQDIRDSIAMLEERNSDVKEEVEKYGRVDAYYQYSKGNFAEAIPFIKKALEKDRLSVYQRVKLDDMLMKAAKATGNHADYVAGMEDFVKNEQIIDSLRAVTNEREMTLRNGITSAPLLAAEDLDSKRPKVANANVALIVISAILAILLLIYMSLYIRIKRN